MLSFLKKLFCGKDEIKVFAPCDGEVKKISEISDEVFKECILGDGFFIRPKGDIFYSPVIGKVLKIAETKHAIRFQPKGSNISVLLHIGIDTVKGKGKGIEVFVKEGSIVNIDTEIAKINKAVLKKYASSLDTPVIVFKESLSGESINLVSTGNLKHKDCILTIK